METLASQHTEDQSNSGHAIQEKQWKHRNAHQRLDPVRMWSEDDG